MVAYNRCLQVSFILVQLLFIVSVDCEMSCRLVCCSEMSVLLCVAVCGDTLRHCASSGGGVVTCQCLIIGASMHKYMYVSALVQL